ncbi:hypothetical protein MIMGU_mgv1a023129mg, partial [Erythranthe guttata]
MEDLCAENTIPHHATFDAVAEHEEMVEFAPVVAKEETAESVGGDNTDEDTTIIGNDHGVAAKSFSERGGESEDVVCSKRKRGRPRKQSVGGRQQFPRKSRPKGSTKNLTASLGGIVEETAGRNFTFHTITIEQGEDIVQRIRSFSEMTPDSICIISASGTVSIAEGELTIIHLNGSHTYDGIIGAKKCLLSALLADSKGRCYGGAVAGSLIFAWPTRVIIGTFIQILRHRKRRTAAPESATRAALFPRSV